MGVNKLNTIMKGMTQAAGISGKTNHSDRKTLVQKLQDSGVPPTQIVQITGHKNLQSVNNYSSLREQQMENILHILSSNTTTATTTCTVVKPTESKMTTLPLPILLHPLHLLWTSTPSMRTGFKRCFTAIT